MKKVEAISILATSVRPREPKDRARYDEAVKMAIEALKCSETPKSSERTAKTAQDVKNGDLIFRQVAIEALRKCQTYLFDERDPDKKIELRSAEWAIEDLPSAQPDNQMNLCDSCDYLYPDCPAKNDDVIFGNGIGNDNICACNKYKPFVQPEQRWIPCSERLPEIGEYVLCYLKGRRYFGQYRVCKYCAADKYVNHPYFDFNENGFPNVVAWMPLPEAYRGGDE